MTTKQKLKNEKIVEVLESQLALSEQFWNERTQSPAFIVGYLQGVIKSIISELKDVK